MSADRCTHDWRERDYVCELCGAVKRGAPPLWVFELRISPGLWAVLLALWTFADGTPDSRPVWPGNAALRARARGIAASTLRERLAELKSLGWIRLRDTHRREFELAWLDPYPPETRTLPAGNLAPRRKPGPPETQRTPAGNLAPDRQEPGATPPETWTHTYHDVGSDLGLTEVVERATPTPSPIATPSRQTRGAAPTHAKPPRDLATPRPIGNRSQPAKPAQSDQEQSGVLDPPSFEARVRAASEAAYCALDGSSTSRHSWAAVMREAQLDLGIDDDGAIEALVLWQAHPREGRPTMGRLWQRSTKGGQGGRDWVRDQLGLGVNNDDPRNMRAGMRIIEGGEEIDRTPVTSGLGARTAEQW